MVLLISILTLIMSLIYSAMMLFLRSGWEKLGLFVLVNKQFKTSVSVLIAARNEENNIDKTISDILSQDYPADLFQLIIVDDHSTDRTADIVQSYASRGVKLIRLNEGEMLNSYKKKAISEAIKFSDAELIVTSDADCRMGSQWLSTIVGLYESGDYKLISSPVAYFQEKNTFEKVQSLEFLFLIGGMGAAGIGNKMPTTCNGANLAYRRDVFLELKGFQGIDDLASGDDELFLHKVALAYPEKIGFCKSRNAIVYTHAKSNLGSFIEQRRRWASKSTRYKNKSVLLLGVFVWLYNLLFIFNAIAGFSNPVFWQLCLLSLMLKMFVELIILIPLCSFSGKKELLRYLPLLSVVHIFYLIFIGIAGNSGKYYWKGRLVR
nr:glycosyltransferase [Daejeonella sp. H1SJ63]